MRPVHFQSLFLQFMQLEVSGIGRDSMTPEKKTSDEQAMKVYLNGAAFAISDIARGNHKILARDRVANAEDRLLGLHGVSACMVGLQPVTLSLE
jgi:hypothetical protein